MAVTPQMRLLLLCVSMLTLAVACGPAPAAPAANAPGASAPAPRVRLRSAYTSESASELPLLVTHEAGLFAEQGLDVAVERIAGGSSKVVQVMLANELEVAQIGGPAVIDAHLAGVDLVFVATSIPVLGLTIYATPGINRMEDLRGKAIAVTRAGTVSDFGARYALTRHNLRPDEDVGVIQTGGIAESMAAMQSGQVAAGVIGAPLDVPARRLGLHELLDLPSLGLDFLQNGLAVQRDYLAKNDEPLSRFVRAYTAGTVRLKRDKAFAKQVLAKYVAAEDEESLESGYDSFGNRYLARVPYPTASQLVPIVEFAAEREPRARELRPEAMVDDHFVRALDQSGFVEQLYR